MRVPAENRQSIDRYIRQALARRENTTASQRRNEQDRAYRRYIWFDVVPPVIGWFTVALLFNAYSVGWMLTHALRFLYYLKR